MSAFSGAAGILIALVALVFSICQANQTKRDAIRERRNDFELGLLAEIRRQMAISNFDHLAGYVGALIADPADENTLPMTRAKIEVKPTAAGRQSLADAVQRTKSASPSATLALRVEIEAEVDAAIQARLEN